MLPFTTDTVTVVHAAKVQDSYNNLVRDWANASRTTVRGVAYLKSTVESVQGKDQTTSVYRFFLPTGIAVIAQDRLEWNGMTLEVDGDPAIIKGPTHRLDHTEVSARVVAG